MTDYLQSRSICIYVLVLFNLSVCPLRCLQADPVCCFLAGGTVFRVDIANRQVSSIGSLHTSAPDIDVAGDGLVWGRGDLSSVAALDPSNGEEVARVDLPQRPYLQIITPSGKLYISHNTLTSKGFSISVVDTVSKRLIKRIQGIQGIVTGLALDQKSVYIAAVGVRRPDFLYLYRICTETDTLEEIYRAPKTFYRWEISTYRNLLYLTYVRGANGEAPPLIEVMDLGSHQIVDRWTFSSEIRRILEQLSFYETSAYALVMCRDGDHGIAVFDPESGKIKRVLPLRQAPSRIIGIHNNCLVYTASPQVAGVKGIALHFYQIDQATEIHSVNIQNQFLEEATQ